MKISPAILRAVAVMAAAVSVIAGGYDFKFDDVFFHCPRQPVPAIGATIPHVWKSVTVYITPFQNREINTIHLVEIVSFVILILCVAALRFWLRPRDGK